MKTCLRARTQDVAGAAAVEWPRAFSAPPASCFAIWLEEIRRACGAFEWVTFTYLTLVNTLIAIFHTNLSHPERYLIVHQCVAAGIVLLAWAAERWPNSSLRFLRHWYPLPLYIGFFEELRGLVHLVFPEWFDAALIRFDFWLCGAHPSVWMSQFAKPALNDFMQFSYMTYFLYLVILPAILYVRREPRAFWTVMTSTAVAHYTVYVIALLFPIESPYFSLAALQHVPLPGGVSTALISLIERFGRVHGAAFPSAHVAGSMVVILASWRYRRWLFWVCLPFFVSMLVATVYGRYHYVADVLAGMLTGAIGFIIGQWLMMRRGALPGTTQVRLVSEENGGFRAVGGGCANRSLARKRGRFPAGELPPTSGR